MDLTDKILISLQSSKNPHSARNIRSNHPMFDRELIFRYSALHDTLWIEEANMSFTGRTVKPYHVNGSKDKRFQTSDTRIQPGLYQIDEDHEDYIRINLLEPLEQDNGKADRGA